MLEKQCSRLNSACWRATNCYYGYMQFYFKTVQATSVRESI